MPPKKHETANNILALLVTGAFILTMIAAGLTLWQRKEAQKGTGEVETTAQFPIEKPPIIEYSTDENGQEPNALTEQRKATLGIEEGIDLILKADEALKIGGTVVSMQEILDRVKLKRGDILEDDLHLNVTKTTEGMVNEDASGVYGIHVVKPGDNIWNIHFLFLQDYFKKRGVALSPLSDEATAMGYSSGVGKLLKFSENMVYIYNIRERKLDVDLNLIHALTKVIVFDMGQVFALLEQIDYEHVNRIQFDGETLWVPASQ